MIKLMKNQIVYIDKDNVLVDFTTAFPYLSNETMKEYEGQGCVPV